MSFKMGLNVRLPLGAVLFLLLPMILKKSKQFTAARETSVEAA